MIRQHMAHYKITGKLGKGGMGEVYRATDTKLDREVAIKVLPESFAQNKERLARFDREAKALAALNHPNIAGIYGIEQSGDSRALILELVEGEDLSERLQRGALPVHEALDVCKQIAEALEAAHEKGIIHRDLKPGNIKMTPNGRVKVLDFGLAKMTQTHPGEVETTKDPESPTRFDDATLPGMVMGTPAYMSPEQVRGQAVDKQTDIWAFGCCLFECLSGRKPFGGQTASDLMAEVLKSDPDWALLPTLTPARIQLLVQRCLVRDRAKRLADIREAWTEINARTSAVTGSASVTPLTLPDKPSIAVLPFNNVSGDPEQEFFADGVVESITATLSRIRSFFVIARNSAFRYKGSTVNIPAAGRELGVRYLLEGSVQKAGQRLRITVHLIDAAANTHIWADRVDGTLEDIFELQDRITERVAGALQPSIQLAEIERARRKRPQDLGAYDYAMRAMPFAWALEMEASESALKLLEKALAIDPAYPLALSITGWCHAQRMVYNWTDDIDAARGAALRHAEQAAELSGDDPLILAVLGAVHSFLRNYGTARIMIERAVALDPNAAWAWSRLGWVENYSDQSERAIENFQRALRLSPLDPINFNNYVGMGAANEIAGRFEEAVALYRRALQERPRAHWILRNLVSSLVGAGRVEEAKMEFVRMCSAYPGLTIGKFKKAMVFSPAMLDRMGERLKTLGLPD